MSELIRTEGVILRVTPFEDDHLILSAFTLESGKVSLFARGARRARSRFGPEIDLLSRSELIYLPARNVKPLREATLLDHFSSLKAHYEALTGALGAARLLSLLTAEEQADPHSYRLWRTLLETLDREPEARQIYLLAFSLRLLDSFGIGPRLEACSGCGRSGKALRFSLEEGGVRCERCSRVGDIALSPGLLQSLRALRTLSWQRLHTLRPDAETLRTGAQLLERFTEHHVRPLPRRTRSRRARARPPS